MKPNQFAKDYKKSYSSGEGPTADLLGQVAVALDGVKYKKKKDKMTFTVDPSDRTALKELDPADACEVEFLTPCDAPPPPPPPAATCSYTDTTCAVGATCPGGTAVLAECADRGSYDDNPCVCTALQELAGLSTELQAAAPWNNDETYCVIGDDYTDDLPWYDGEDQYFPFLVKCETVDGVDGRPVHLPTKVGAKVWGGLPEGTKSYGDDEPLTFDLSGALPPSLGDLGPSLWSLVLWNNAITSVPTELGALTGLRYLKLSDNAITSVPTELGALTGLTFLRLDSNQLTGVPTDFRTWGPSEICWLFDNPGFSCANVGAGTSCCTGDVQFGNNCGEGLSGGPCYAG